MDNRPIGMFDSGVGGLTVLKEFITKYPNENFIYLGDTKRFPYGSKSKETIIQLTKSGIDFLISKNVKSIIIACGTATSQALDTVKKYYDIPIAGIINETVKYIKNKKYKNIGIIATSGTIRSNGWQEHIYKLIPDAHISSVACPLLAPMAEEGWTENEIARLTIKEYLKSFKNIDCLILGCTHYPLFTKFIKEELGDNVDIINTGEILSNSPNELLLNKNFKNEISNLKYDIYLTDTETNFINVASKLLDYNDISNKIKKCNI